MATEPKTEAKTEARQEAKTEARQEVIEGNTEPSHKYKTWMLKVSVHCEQCKRKVKKVLDSIDGVYSTDIDLRLQKATVVGDVDADTLIKRLKKKTRKHAELWPEKAVGDQKEAMKKDKAKNKEKGKEKEEQRDQESSNEAGGDGGGHVVTGKACEGGSGAAVQAKEVKVTGKQPVASPDVGQSPVADKKVGGESTGSSGQGDVQVHAPPPANHIPPRHDHVYDYPTTYYAPPVYATSSNVAYPSTSYGASYYAPPQYSYAYMNPGTHPGTFSEPPPYDFHQYSSQPSDSFDILSDENPNACSIM
ncbi:COPPER CHAPERONE putative-RELATED [Salix koriyanagi]|uniref:COPPER CHAPERONE putative-RELATED n=1 Tax=Salix koriyanagi TaxID=2511006 RepID=A0A9Q1A3S0_9ROSI|nr:COPPER CHAPERONE putative-RELATED [Salix koriyanagi]